MIKTGLDILEYCEKHQCPIHQMMLEKESVANNLSPQMIKEKLRLEIRVMREAVDLAKPGARRGYLIGGEAEKLMSRMDTYEPLSGRRMAKAYAYALKASETNASMGRIVAAPTAGASGILPAVLFTIEESLDLTEDDLIKGLLTAGAIGIVIGENACISGAMGGCQSETGSAAAMAAAAAVELSGGGPKMALDSGAIALANVLGLICDPVLGLVESPCNIRNVLGTANALLAADLALAGIKAVIPFDEAVYAMHEVGMNMPKIYKETALGGLATSETARALGKKKL